MRALPLLLTLLCAGCSTPDSTLQSWWGPVSGNQFNEGAGDGFGVTGLVHRQITDDPQRDYLHLAFVGTNAGTVSCSQYGLYLQRVGEVQAWVDDLIADYGTEPPAGWDQHVCQQVRGAAVEAFGGRGEYRALHALLDVTGGGPESGIFRSSPPGIEEVPFLGGELVSTGQYATRWYERSQHGAGVLPDETPMGWEGGDPDPVVECDGFARRLYDELLDGRTTYPDRASLALQSGTHRYYHLHKNNNDIGLPGNLDLELGFVFPEWAVAATTGAVVVPSVWTEVSRVPNGFPYEEVLLTSEGRPVQVLPCPTLGDHAGLVWPEVPAFGVVPAGDDDDSAR